MQNSSETTFASVNDGKENRMPRLCSTPGHRNDTRKCLRRQSFQPTTREPTTSDTELFSTSSILGKRSASYTSPESECERDRDTLLVSNAVTHFEARAEVLHADTLELETNIARTGSSVLLLNDSCSSGQLDFGTVALGNRSSRQLTLQNPSDIPNIRVKYNGYSIKPYASDKLRFKCDLHVCVVKAFKSVPMRVTFEPLPVDVGKVVTAVLKFLVNDQTTLQCRVTGRVLPRENSRVELIENDTHRLGDKRSLSVSMAMPNKRTKTMATKPLTKSLKRAVGSTGSWWKKRQKGYDVTWMNKQTEAFMKWMNYVLLKDRVGQESVGNIQENGLRTEFTSLRVLVQKRMEEMWILAARALYRSEQLQDLLFALQDEIGNQRLVFRADRPVYADVGLQEELLELLNRYHPVWLCLGLYAVLGTRVMQAEKCLLRTIFRTPYGTKAKKDDKMPLVLRRVILKHLVKDENVAQNYRLVQNLKTPLDGSTADRMDGGNAFVNTKKHINGREYFDSLTQSFMLKYLMLVLFLDRVMEHKTDTFEQLPCLFRKSSNVASQDSDKSCFDGKSGVKTSQVFVTEFCRLFLASEGRIDKHLKQIGYEVTYEQTALDEVDLEVTDLTTDLRDGIRLAKLMEALTNRPTARDKKTKGTTRGLSTFLRVPALSRLQKIHNVELCLYFLQEKCGTSVLKTLQRSTRTDDRLYGRVKVSSSGFAGLEGKVNEKRVGMLAKTIVSGHREKTLALLWTLISSFQLQSLVDASRMRQEIATVIKRMSFHAKECFDRQQEQAPLGCTYEHESYSLLLEWCRAVCANYDVSIHDFTSSFADGKALCYLLHYYHPMLLLKSDVLPTTCDVKETDAESVITTELLANEQQHFTLVNDRIKQLGQVPVLMPQDCNSKNPPEDKMVVTFVCYLQSRLMESCSEINAASRLKRWWQSPWIRLRLYRNKTNSARVVQRFWYTSSQKRLAIRQCRKLLRAASVVKATVQMSTARKRFLRLRRSVLTLQRIFHARCKSRFYLKAATCIQTCWRKHLRWRHEKDRHTKHDLSAQLGKMRASCVVIERVWLQYLSRGGARLVRQQMLADWHAAVNRIQVCWRQSYARQAARMKRQQLWQQRSQAVRTLERRWLVFQHHRREMQRLKALQRFNEMMREKKHERCRRELQRRVETRAVTCIQKHFRIFMWCKREAAATKVASVFRCKRQQLRFQEMRQATIKLQHNVRAWRQQRLLLALTQFYNRLQLYNRRMVLEAQRRDVQVKELKHKVGTRAACCIQKKYRSYQCIKQNVAATQIQTLVRGWHLKTWYRTCRYSACVIQQNVRVWRRQRQLCALQSFYSMLLNYRRLQREEEERLEQIRQDRLDRLQKKLAHRAARRIQAVYSVYVFQKRTVAATLIQAVVRGYMNRHQYAVTWNRVVVLQRAFRSWLVRSRFCRALYRHRAAVKIQKYVRGWVSRRFQFDFFTFQAQLQRLHLLISCWRIEWWYAECIRKYQRKRTLMVRAHWRHISAGLWQKRSTQVQRIETCWRLHRFKQALNARIQITQARGAAAQCLQVWWLTMKCTWAERARRNEECRQRKITAMALALARARAERLVASWLIEYVVDPYRQRHEYLVAVRRLQAWWRGMWVRLRQCSVEVTQQRQKLSGMRLVEQDANSFSKHPQALRVKVSDRGERRKSIEPSQTLGSRLDTALHMLLHGKRLQDMLFASHTIEVCTRYSRECCHKCVQLRISSTIFEAIRGLNRSRPHVELLHQLLLVLKNLTRYRRSADRRNMALDDSKERLEVDLRALDTLVDLLHIHRDMHHVFVLSATVITYYLERLRFFVDTSPEAFESWNEAEKRLTGLQELLKRKLALFNATASFRRVAWLPETSNATNLMRKMDPKTAVATIKQLTDLVHR
ncbi:hypothetical protein CCR75_008709 [Bremia lactucae]|uniref:Calponin-homology (CH) domain-containing protein n=1 Tax=Bremia lactucae TaxID=4779 RepID=A0A976IL31_BRELC|nr:hypothetical protein CCR75_008709 [Bremia lactucae]